MNHGLFIDFSRALSVSRSIKAYHEIQDDDVTTEDETPRQSVAAGYECSNATVETGTALARALQQNTSGVLSSVSGFDPQQDLQTT